MNDANLRGSTQVAIRSVKRLLRRHRSIDGPLVIAVGAAMSPSLIEGSCCHAGAKGRQQKQQHLGQFSYFLRLYLQTVAVRSSQLDE